MLALAFKTSIMMLLAMTSSFFGLRLDVAGTCHAQNAGKRAEADFGVDVQTGGGYGFQYAGQLLRQFVFGQVLG